MKLTIVAGTILMTLGGCTLPPLLTETGAEAAPASGAAPVASYCYKTLAGVDCYRAPRDGDRLVGVDIQPPR